MSNIDVLGLTNENSVCYLNSLFQCLISCPSFISHLSRRNSNEKLKFIVNCYINRDQSIVSKLINETNPDEEQHCVHEAFHYIIDKYNLENMFEMTFTEILVCTSCTKIIERKRDKQIIYNHFEEKDLSSDLIEKSFSPVRDFNCSRCHKKTLIIIKRFLTELPKILVVCLNKFFGKEDITFPEKLKIQNKTYELVADIQHIGNMNGGHYFARAKRNNKYHQINDTVIQEIQDLKPTKNAYLLFYN